MSRSPGAPDMLGRSAGFADLLRDHFSPGLEGGLQKERSSGRTGLGAAETERLPTTGLFGIRHRAALFKTCPGGRRTRVARIITS